MSYRDFTTAMKQLPELPYFASVPLASMTDLKRAERIFGKRFSRQNRLFYKKLNYATFAGVELLGIIPEHLLCRMHADAIVLLDMERSTKKLPPRWLPLCDLDDGYFAYLDYSQRNAMGEPPVISVLSTLSGYCSIEVRAKDLGEFLLLLARKMT